jgi:outer membrane protein OmpA-like peptidoglycan-associated protein
MGDPVVLTARVEAVGNVKLLPRPALTLPWATITPGEERVRVDSTRSRISGSKEYDWIVTPRVAGAPLRPGTLAYDIDRFMGSKDGLPRTFTFDAVNFDSGTANLRAADSSDLDDIARVLAAYPESRAAIVGYADALGDSRFNRDLGANRAQAVIAALASRGVAPKRLEARSGGETDPAATNATPGGRFENRRTELVILER